MQFKSYENVKHFNTEKFPFFYVGTWFEDFRRAGKAGKLDL